MSYLDIYFSTSLLRGGGVYKNQCQFVKKFFGKISTKEFWYNLYMKMLLGTLLWCPSSETLRCNLICDHLDYLEKVSIASGDLLDILVCVNHDENGTHPLLLEKLGSISHRIKEFSPQVGWSKGRDYMMYEFMCSSSYSLLGMIDCDIFYNSVNWVNDCLDLQVKYPELNAYMLRPDYDQLWKHAKYKDLVVGLYQEWLGTTNIVSREVIETIGGFSYPGLPDRWGFTDPLYGRRLKKSGLLSPVYNQYVDPLNLIGEHRCCPSYDLSMSDFKNSVISEYNKEFLKLEAGIASGKLPVYNPLGFG